MTEYFEVHERDGAARLGELRLDPPLQTPALVDDRIEDSGSLWSDQQDVPAGDETSITILPHRSMPPGTPETVQQSFQPSMPSIDGESAAVVSGQTVTDHGTDVYVLSTAGELVGHAAAFVETIIAVREAIPADTALYLPGVATPGNVGILAYAGVDLVDADRAVLRGTQQQYLTPDGEQPVADLEELPCSCPACQQPVESFDQDDCIAHNKAQLTTQLRRVRNRIRRGQLRDYLEAQGRHDQWQTATFRRFDQQWDYLEQRTPLVRQHELTAASDDTLNRVEIKRFADRVTERYRPRLDDMPLVLVPCSAYKPYSESQSHRQFYDAIDYRGHIVSLTSPIGVVPYELELTYPAQHYDTVVTGHWSETELDFVTQVLKAYLEGTAYPRIIAHVPTEGYRELIERAVGDRPVTYTVSEHPTDDASLSALDGALADTERYSRARRRQATVRAIADYMFGPGAGDTLFDTITVEGRYPSLRVLDDNGEQLGAVVPRYGILSLTLAGARRWQAVDVPTKTVHIDGFVPHGSVLAPGVQRATETIRPGDEVLITGPKAFGVGRARMSGPEMVNSTRGVATGVRHVTER